MKDLIITLFMMFFGGSTGTLLALSVNQNFWWTGMLLGAGVGYIFADYEELVQKYQQLRGWKVDVAFWKRYGTLLYCYTFGGLGAMLPLIAICVIVITWFVFRFGREPVENPLQQSVIWISSLALFSWLIGLGMVSCLFITKTPEKQEEEIQEHLELFERENVFKFYLKDLPKYFWNKLLQIKAFSPVTSLKNFAISTWAKLVIVITFTVKLIKAIHSIKRVVVAFDLALAVLLGYLAESVLLGGALSVSFYVLHVKIFSQKILGLTYAKS